MFSSVSSSHYFLYSVFNYVKKLFKVSWEIGKFRINMASPQSLSYFNETRKWLWKLILTSPTVVHDLNFEYLNPKKHIRQLAKRLDSRSRNHVEPHQSCLPEETYYEWTNGHQMHPTYAAPEIARIRWRLLLETKFPFLLFIFLYYFSRKHVYQQLIFQNRKQGLHLDCFKNKEW